MSITRITFNIITRGIIAPEKAFAQDKAEGTSVPPKPLNWNGVSSTETEQGMTAQEKNQMLARLRRIISTFMTMDARPTYVIGNENPHLNLDKLYLSDKLIN